MPVVARVILCALGCAILGLSVFVYEDEEKELQNHLEMWWIKLDDAQRRSTAIIENVILRRSLRVVSALIDQFFGPRAFSTRAALASFSASFLGMWLFIAIVHILIGVKRGPGLLAATREYWILAAAFFVLSLFEKWGCLIVSAVGSPLVYLFVKFCLTRHQYGFLFGTALGLPVSIFLDMVVLLVVRKVVTNPPQKMLTAKTLILSICLIGSVITMPILIFKHASSIPPPISPPTSISLAMTFGFLSLSDLVVFGLFFVVAALLALHILLWHLITRPMYTLQRCQVFEHRKIVGSIGIGLIGTGLGWGRPSVISAFDFVKKMLGF